MTETQGAAPVPAASGNENRMMALAVYALFIAAFCNGITAVVGVIIAYIKRGEVRGTIWESHFENAITAFWVGAIAFVIGCATFWILGLGFLIMGFGAIYFLYRSIKGLIRALDAQPYI